MTSVVRVRAPSGPRGWVPVVAALLLALIADAGWAQSRIGGVVVEANTNRPLGGAQVVIPATQQGTLTRPDGTFVLENVPPGQVELQVMMLGYAAWRQTVGSGTTDLEVRLEQRAVELDAVVVTGTPGAQRIRSLGNAVGTVNAAELQEIATPPSVESLLSGTVSGVNVAPGGGEIGGGANIRIRGASSISLSSQPLVYVDGVRVNGSNIDVGGGIGGVGVDNGTPPSRLNDINPDDIASIEVIKGPAAATLYGTEASNGVINIITKKGTQGAPQFTMTVKQGLNQLPDHPEDYFPSTYFRCRGTSGECTPGEIVEFNVLREDRIRNGNEWFQSGRPQGYSAAVNGGTETLNYYFSLDWDRDEGIVSYNWQNQLGGRANLSWQAREDLNLQFGISGIRSTLESASANQPVTTAILWACPAPGCEAGSGLPNAVDGAMRGYIGYLPERLQNDVDGFQDVLRSTYNVTLTHNPREWFSHRLIWGADWTDTDNSELYRPINGVGHGQPAGSKTVQRQTAQFLSLDYSGTGTLDLGSDLSLATSAGVQYYQKQSEWVYARGQTFPVAALETVSAGAIKSAEEGFVENKTLGAFVQEQISWRDRLFLTGALRGDDNSAFGENFDFVLYPKLSASWVVTDEPFARGTIGWLSQLRLRSAWGRAGQQPDVFAAIQTYEPVAGAAGVATLTPNAIGNPDVQPEVGEELEVGFDASLFEDLLGIEFTFYDQSRKDALIRVPVRPSSGFPGTQFRNLGEVRNRGIELAVNANAYRGSSADLDLGLTLSTNDNELVSLGGLPPQILQGFNPTTGWAHQLFVEGYPLGAIWLKKVVSADIQGTGADARAVNAMCEGGELVPGTTDLSAGGGAAVPCAQAPYIFRGAPVPTREVTGTATLTLLDNLQIYAQVDYQGGSTMVDGNSAGAHLFFRNTREILERDDPFLLAYESLGSDGINQAGLIDASFVKLRRLSATYNFPRAWSGRFGADRLALTLSAQNVFTLWQATEEMFGYRIFEPEMRDTQGTDTDPGGLSAYRQEAWPPLRRFLATIRVAF